MPTSRYDIAMNRVSIDDLPREVALDDMVQESDDIPPTISLEEVDALLEELTEQRGIQDETQFDLDDLYQELIGIRNELILRTTHFRKLKNHKK
jgi:hypothetical protein